MLKPRTGVVVLRGSGNQHLEAGDVIIDGGNSYRDDIARAAAAGGKSIHHGDVGTSRGVWNLERGYCLMIGGEDEVAEPAADLRGHCSRRREGRTDPGAHPGTQSGRARLSPLRAERRGALREDGAAPGGRGGRHRLAQGRTSPMKAPGEEGRA
jgi:NAD binding domain of 6-phosphogluconate dehydrogenase